MAAQLLCEKALGGGGIGTEEEQGAPDPTVVQKKYLDRNKAVLQSLVALTSGGGSSAPAAISRPEIDL